MVKAAHPEHDLLQAYADGELAPELARALESRLRVEPALADAYLLIAREDAVVREWVSAQAAARDEQQRQAQPARPRRWKFVQVAAVVAVAACLLAAVGILFWSTPARVPAGSLVATLEEVQGEVKVVASDGMVALASEGHAVYAGQEVQTGEDDSSTIVRIQDCRFVLASSTHIRLGDDRLNDVPLVYVSEGLVAAELTPRRSGKPVVMRSPLAEMRGSKGKFSFVSLPDATFVEADDGLARLTRKSDGHSIDLPRGKFAVVKPSTEPLQPRALAKRSSAPTRNLGQAGGPVQGLFFEPEGMSLLASAGDSVKRWQLATGKLVGTIYSQKKRPIRQFSAALDGGSFAAGHEERSVKLIDSMTGAERTYRNSRRVLALALSPDGQTLAVSWGGRDGYEVRLYETRLGLERTLHTGHTGPVNVLAFSPRGTYVATVSSDRSIRFWAAADLRPLGSFIKLVNDVRSIAFSPDEQILAAGERKGTVRFFDMNSGAERRILTGHMREVVSLAFAPDGTRLVTGSSDGTARLWQVAKGYEIATLKGHSGNVSAVAYAHDGRTLATGGADRKILLWDINALQPE